MKYRFTLDDSSVVELPRTYKGHIEATVLEWAIAFDGGFITKKRFSSRKEAREYIKEMKFYGRCWPIKIYVDIADF